MIAGFTDAFVKFTPPLRVSATEEGLLKRSSREQAPCQTDEEDCPGGPDFVILFHRDLSLRGDAPLPVIPARDRGVAFTSRKGLIPTPKERGSGNSTTGTDSGIAGDVQVIYPIEEGGTRRTTPKSARVPSSCMATASSSP